MASVFYLGPTWQKRRGIRGKGPRRSETPVVRGRRGTDPCPLHLPVFPQKPFSAPTELRIVVRREALTGLRHSSLGFAQGKRGLKVLVLVGS